MTLENRLALFASFWSDSLGTVALLVFYSLTAASALYLLQRYMAFPFSAESRLVLFGLLVLLTLGVQRKLLRIPPLFWILGATVVWAGIHTYLRSDWNLAVAATLRFSDAMILAPLAAVLLARREHLVVVFEIMAGVYLIALATLIFQHWGGSLDSLTQGYVAIRGDLVRHMTAVGEPNVGGMLSAVVFIYGVLIPKRMWIAILLGGSAVAFVFLSISKAAMLGLLVAVVAGSIVLTREERLGVTIRALLAGLAGVFFLHLLGAEPYLWVAVDSVFGDIRGEPSAIKDLHLRQGTLQMLSTVFDGSMLPAPLNYFLGASFVGVGSAAQEVLGPGAGVVLPHNSYLELFMTGGLVLLGCVLLLMARAYANLWPATKIASERVDQCALVCLAVLSSWMLVYPVIYEPVTGCLFWIIVGYGNRPRTSPQGAEAIQI